MKSNCRILFLRATRCTRNLRFWKNASPNRNLSGASLKCALAEYSRQVKSSSTMRQASCCTRSPTLPNNIILRKYGTNDRGFAEKYSSRALGRAGSGIGSFRGGTSLHADSGRHGGRGHQDREAGNRRLDSQLGLG